MSTDLPPRVLIERNLAMSFLMQLEDAAPAAVASMLPAYELADTAEARANASADRVMAVLGLDPHDVEAAESQASLLEWFLAHDAEIDER